MFDLFRRRDKALRYILTVLLGLVALSMVITLIPGYGGGGNTSSDSNVLAEVGGDAITSQEVQQVLRNATKNQIKAIPANGMTYNPAITTIRR